MMMLFRSAFTVMFFLQPRDLQVGSHIIIMGVNVNIIYFNIHVYE